MTHPIIKTDNYILITSDEEILIGDVVLSKLNQIILFSKYYDPKLYKKVIAHLPLNNSPILEGVPLLPPLPPLPMTFPTIECIGDNLWEELTGGQEVSVNRGDWSFGFGIGYNKAKEKYKFTEEDMIKAFEYGKTLKGYDCIGDLIESLSQPKLPVGFNCRIEYLTSSPKIINGVMQGQWIY